MDLPHSKKHEYCLLSIMFQDPLVYGKAIVDEFSDEQPFFTPEGKMVWEAFTRIDMDKINKYTVADYLVDRLDMDIINSIYMTEPHTAQFEVHKQWVRKLFTQRELLKVTEEATQSLLDPKCKVDDIIPLTQKMLSEKMLHTGKSTMMTMDDMVERTIKQLQSGQDGFRTYYHRLDRIIAPIPEGSLMTIAGRSGYGKTTLYNNIQVYLGLSGIGSSIFSLEMQVEQLVKRMVASLLRENSSPSNIMAKWNTKEFVAGFNWLKQLPIMAKDTPSINIKQLRREILALNAGEGVKIHGVDHIGLVKVNLRKSSTRAEEVAYIADTLKETAMEIKGLVVAIAQLNREAEGRVPKISHLKESGRIEESSDIVVMLHGNRNNDEDITRMKQGEPVEINLIVEKSRHTSPGTLLIPFFKQYSFFPNDVTDYKGDAI